MPMNPEIKAQWIADLRSGSFEQGTGRLQALDSNGVTRHCCLNILCLQAVKAGVIAPATYRAGRSNAAYLREDGSQESGLLPPVVATWAGLRAYTGPIHSPMVKLSETMRERLLARLVAPAVARGTHPAKELSLATLNDTFHLSFGEIADVIEGDPTL